MKQIFYFIGLIATAYTFLLLLPINSKPQLDEHLFYESVQNFVQKNENRIHAAIFPTFLAQLFYGILFTKMFGLSYVTLRLSTVLLSGIAVGAFYLLLHEKFQLKISILGALLLLTNPIFYLLSRTFMTDIPAFTFGILAVLFLYRNVKTPKTIYLFFGMLFSILAFFVRQFYIFIPIATFFYYFLERDKTLVRKFIIFILIPIFIFLIWFYWMTFVHGLPRNLHIFIPQPVNTINNVTKSFYYLGLFNFTLPLLFIINKELRVSILHKKIFILTLLVMIIFIIFRLLAGKGLWFPGNILGPTGFLIETYEENVYASLFLIVAALAWLSTFFILQIAVRFFSREKFLILQFAFPFVFIMLLPISWDRYFLFPFFVLLPVIFTYASKMEHFMVFLIFTVLLFVVWTILGNFEYLSRL
jgi:4-amino-4-deoxy-L-arabinose transferase-like glycosyltransferase